MTAAIDITPAQRKTLLGFLRRYIPGVAVWAYGSRVKWTARPNSDLDLVTFTKPEQRYLVSELKEALNESSLPFLVDLHIWDDVPERFHEIIRKEYIVLLEAAQPTSCSGMPGWKDITLGDFVALQRGHDLTEPERRPGHVPVIGSAGQNGFHDTALAKGPGIVIGRSGASFGQVHFCATDYWPHNTGLYVTDFKGNDPRFAYYFLKALDFDRYNSGSAQPSLNRNFIYPIPICVPEPDEQKAIARILSTLDDKIELNRRMNATLEEMARALFQSWFVDFDPVRAKLDGRQLVGIDATTAALFPSHFQDSPLGHIPQGWTAGTVSDGFDLTMGQSPPGDTYNEEGNGLPFYQGRTDFGFRFPKRRIYCTAPTRYAKPGDTLVSVRAPVGDINMVNEECCIGRGVAAVRHKSGATSFTYHSMANLYPDFANFEAEGTVFGSINKDSFEKLRFVIPPSEIVVAYEHQAAVLDDQIRTLENQSRTLATLRDSLLPKLLSKEVGVIATTYQEVGAAQ